MKMLEREPNIGKHTSFLADLKSEGDEKGMENAVGGIITSS